MAVKMKNKKDGFKRRSRNKNDKLNMGFCGKEIQRDSYISGLHNAKDSGATQNKMGDSGKGQGQ